MHACMDTPAHSSANSLSNARLYLRYNTALVVLVSYIFTDKRLVKRALLLDGRAKPC